MSINNYKSRLKRIEEKKNTYQAVMFVLLTIGFIALLIFIGFPLFIKGAVWFGERKSAQASNIKNDNVSPIPPSLNYYLEATKSATISLDGYSESESVVSIFLNSKKITDTIADENGTFKFSNFELVKGNNEIYTQAKDKAENESQASKIVSIVYDDKAPQLEVTNPSDGAKFFDEEREVLVAGKTDPDTNLRINGSVAVVDTEGNFVKRMYLTEGDNEIKIEATDEAGNKIEKIIKVHYQK